VAAVCVRALQFNASILHLCGNYAFMNHIIGAIADVFFCCCSIIFVNSANYFLASDDGSNVFLCFVFCFLFLFLFFQKHYGFVLSPECFCFFFAFRNRHTFAINHRYDRTARQSAGERVYHLVSAHSWLGVIVIALLACQAMAGSAAYWLWPRRRSGGYGDVHRYFGFLTHFSAILAVLTGLSQ
jgi:nicotinamide riboside transporter PnuC